MISLLDQNFSSLNEYIATQQFSQIFILVDEHTHQYCLPILLENLETDLPFEIIEIEAGEEHKNINTTVQLWEILSEFQADRKSLLLNLGGGVVTDIGGFVASTYKRGIRFINLPTTLLAMVDASIGGKTGIDHLYLKNIIGTFAEAETTFVFTNFLKTLPFQELRSGFAEMIKHGLIADKKHWEDLTAISTLTTEAIAPYIETSMKIKQAIVKEDFQETNIRKNLNFGHTVGHAIESLFIANQQHLPHGEAVALGIIIETHLAYLEGLITKDMSETIIAKIRSFYPKIAINHFSNESILNPMRNDKKNHKGHIRFALINDIGSCLFDYRAEENNVIKSIDFYKNSNQNQTIV